MFLKKEHPEIFDKLIELNEKIDRLLVERKEFMDSVMEAVSPYFVGDDYINFMTGERVKVEEVYRGSSVGHGDIYKDNSLSDIHCRFSNGDNTSRYGYEWKNPYIKLNDYKEKNEKYISKLEELAKIRKY